MGVVSATQTRPAPWLPPTAPRAQEPVEAAPSRAPWALAAALGVAVLYAAFADGAIGVSEESNLQIGVALLSLVTIAGLLFGGGRLRFTPDRRAALGLLLLAGFAAWCAISLTWSILPDETWIEANRAVTYTLVAALGVVLGSSLPRAAERVALGYLGIATVVALYAVGGKVLPSIFDHAKEISRLRAPLEYWNALALFCVLAVPIAVQAAADERHRPGARLGALLTLLPLLLTISLTYSRGGIVVLVVALAVQIGLSRERLKLAGYAAVGVLAIVPALLVAIGSDDLTTDGLAASARADDGILLGVALVFGALAALVMGRALIRADDLHMSKSGKLAVRRAVALVTAAGVLVLVALTISGWTGDQLQDFTETDEVADRSDPSRVLEANSGNRWVWWEEAAGAAADEPVIGFGAGSFPLVHQLYRDNRIEVRQPHSVPLEFLSETGIVGAVLGVGGLGLLLLAGLARTRWRLGSERAYSAALAAGGVAFALHLWVDWDWDIPGVMLPALIFLGVLAAAPSPEPEPARPGGMAWRGLALAGAGVLLGLFAASAFLPALAREKTTEALERSASNSPEDLREAAELAAYASKLDPFAVDPLFAAAGIADRRGQTALAVEYLTEAVERQPDNARAWVRLGRRQILLDDLAAANQSSEYAVSLDPLGVGSFFVALGSTFDERRSASATGTPLPLELVAPVLPPAPATGPAPPVAAPPPAPIAPPPAPAPAPAPAPGARAGTAARGGRALPPRGVGASAGRRASARSRPARPRCSPSRAPPWRASSRARCGAPRRAAPGRARARSRPRRGGAAPRPGRARWSRGRCRC